MAIHARATGGCAALSRPSVSVRVVGDVANRENAPAGRKLPLQRFLAKRQASDGQITRKIRRAALEIASKSGIASAAVIKSAMASGSWHRPPALAKRWHSGSTVRASHALLTDETEWREWARQSKRDVAALCLAADDPSRPCYA